MPPSDDQGSQLTSDKSNAGASCESRHSKSDTGVPAGQQVRPLNGWSNLPATLWCLQQELKGTDQERPKAEVESGVK